MARTLTNLAVYMTMNNAGLRKGAKDAKNIVSGMGSGLAKIAGAFGIGLGAAGAVAALKKVYSALDDIGKGADRLGITTDAYQELRYAAGKTAVTMEQVEMATTKAGQAVEKAAEGDKKMVAALRQIGLTWQDLAGLSPDKQMEKIGSALSQVENATKRNNAAIEIFGKSGAKLNPLFNSLSDLRDEANALGVVISGDTIRKAEATGDAFDRLGDRMLAAIADSGIVEKLDEIVQALEVIANGGGNPEKYGLRSKEVKWNGPEGGTVKEAYSTSEDMRKALEKLGYGDSSLHRQGRRYSGLFGGVGAQTGENDQRYRVGLLAKDFRTNADALDKAIAELKAAAAQKIGRELNAEELKALEPKIAELKAKYDAIAAMEEAKSKEISAKIDQEIEKMGEANYIAQMKLNGATEGQIALQQRLFSLNKDITELSADQLLNLLEASDAQDQIAEATRRQKEAENMSAYMRDRGGSLRQMALKIGGFDQQALIAQRIQEAMDKKGAALTGGETDMVARMARLEQALTTMPALQMITTESSNNDLARRGGFQGLSRVMSDAERINREIESNTSRTNELLRIVADQLRSMGLI